MLIHAFAAIITRLFLNQRVVPVRILIYELNRSVCDYGVFTCLELYVKIHLRGAFNKFADFFVQEFKIHYVIAIHLMR